MFRNLVVVSIFVIGALCSPIKRPTLPSCKNCHTVDANKINVHLIPHSHDDVGWLKTLDQYYFGHRNDIQKAGVQYIISSSVEALKANSDRRYIQVETAFFWKWWNRQTDEVKQDFVTLVNNGQIEIVNAAWSMNDEAAVNYQSTIDQFTWGLRMINETIGTCGIPRVGWQIDPFGHSREQASIFAQLGYDGEFFARLDYKDKETRIAEKNLEVVWRGSANLENSDMFTSMFPEFYGSPGGFCFDIECGDDPINDDMTSPEYNAPDRMQDFAGRVNTWATYYRTNNVLVPMGGDFQYQAAEKNFINMDKLIQSFEGHPTINVLYSTPSCYIQAVNDAAAANNVEFTVKTDDFFPYGSDPHSYWTGYFTSRPYAKRFERTASNILQAAKQLNSFSKVNGNDMDATLTPLRQAVGVLQHHDAITGTAKQHVANDYSRLLTLGVKKAEPTIAASITNLLKKDPAGTATLNLETCLKSNISVCDISTSEHFAVTVYNPLERPVTHYVRLPVPEGTYTVTGPDGEEEVDVVDSISDFSYLDGFSDTPNPKELVFAARNVPALGIKLYYVERSAAESPEPRAAVGATFGTAETGFTIDDATGSLTSVTMNGKIVEVSQEFLYYNGFAGDNNGDQNRASGAYVFRPLENEAFSLSPDGPQSFVATTGNVVDEVKQVVNDWVTQIIRVYKGDDNNYVEFDWIVGPIAVDDQNSIGREIINRFTVADFDSEEVFYTDSNGRELLKRQLNKRNDFEYDSTLEPISSNYYPITSKIVIKDEAQQLEVAVLNDRAQGGSSLSSGQVELMVHRRLLKDDAFGVGEPLNDSEYDQPIIARGQHYFVVGSSAATPDAKSTAAQERDLALKKLLSPVVLVATSEDMSLANLQDNFNFQFSGLQTALPDNVHILTLESWQGDSYILRLEHYFEKLEDATLSEPAVVDLTGVFSLFEVSEIRETTLGANQWLDEFENTEKLAWNIENEGVSLYKKSYQNAGPKAIEITLNPMQIRTFVIKVVKNA